MAIDSPTGAPSKNRPESSSNSESWTISNLEAETSASFSFAKPLNKGPPPSGFANLNRTGGPHPPDPASSSPPFFQNEQPTFGASSSSFKSHHQQQPSSSSSSSSTKPAPPNRSHAPPPAASPSSSLTPSDASKTWVSGPSQLLKLPTRTESTRPGTGPSNNNSSSTHSPSSKHRPPPSASPPRPTSSRHDQQPSNKQTRPSITQQQQSRMGTRGAGVGERAKSSGRGGTRTDLEQDELDDEGLGSSVESLKGKPRAAEKIPSGQGFGAYAGAKTSFEQRPSSSSRTTGGGGRDPTVSEYFNSPPATNCDDDPVFDEPNTSNPPRLPSKPTTKNPPVSKPPPAASASTGRRSHSARPEEAPKHVTSQSGGGGGGPSHPNPEIVVVGTSSGKGQQQQRVRSKPVSGTSSGNSLGGDASPVGGGGGAPKPSNGADGTRRRLLPVEGGPSGSGSGARKPSAVSGGGGGERRKRPNDDDKENPRRKVSRVVRDLEDTVSQFERRGEEITRLKLEIGSHEKRQKELEAQVATAKKLATEIRRKFANVEDTVTGIIKSKKDLDDSRAAMSKEVEGYQAVINELHEWDTTREDLLRSGNTWFERQRSALKEVLLPLQVSKDEAEARATKSEQSLAVLKEDLSNKASDLAEKSNRVGYLEEESVKKDSSINALVEDIKVINREHRAAVEELKKELKTLRELLTKAEGNTSDLEAAVAEYEREIDQCKTQLAAKEPELPVLQQKITDLDKSLQEKEGLVANLQRDLGTQTKAVEEAKKTSEAFKTDLGNARTRLEELEGHLSRATEDLKAAREEGKKAVEEKEQKINSLAEALEDIKKEHFEVTRNLDVTRTKLEASETLFKGSEGRVQELTKDKKGLERSVEELRQKIQELNSGGSTSSGDASHSRSEFDILAQNLKAAEASSADSATQLKKANVQVVDLQKQVDAASSLESKLAEAESKRVAAEENQKQMKSELEHTVNALSSLRINAASDKEAIDKYKRQASSLQNTVQELQEKKRTLADRFQHKSGPLDPDEGKAVDAITVVIENSFGNRDVGLGNKIKMLDNKVKTLEREKKDLEAKLARANVGKPRNLIEPDRYAVSSPASEQEQEDSSGSGGSGNRKLDSPTSPTPHTAAAGSSKQPGPLKSALKASSKMLPPPVPSRPSSKNRSDEASPESPEAETQMVGLSPPRTSASGAVVPRGAADATSGSRKRGMGLEDLGDYDAESSTVSAPKKSRNNSTGLTTSVGPVTSAAPKAKSQVARRRGK